MILILQYFHLEIFMQEDLLWRYMKIQIIIIKILVATSELSLQGLITYLQSFLVDNKKKIG